IASHRTTRRTLIRARREHGLRATSVLSDETAQIPEPMPSEVEPKGAFVEEDVLIRRRGTASGERLQNAAGGLTGIGVWRLVEQVRIAAHHVQRIEPRGVVVVEQVLRLDQLRFDPARENDAGDEVRILELIIRR